MTGDYDGLTPSQELELRRRRDHEAQRNRNDKVRDELRELAARKHAKADSPKELDCWRIWNAWRRDMDGMEGACGLHKHDRGSQPAVAHRLGVSRRGLIDRLELLGTDSWPPECG